MILMIAALSLFSSESSISVPNEVRRAVSKIVKSIEDSKDMNVLLDAWADLPDQCSSNDCCIDTGDSQAEDGSYRWLCKGDAWKMLPYVTEKNDSSCWFEYTISFQTPVGYSKNAYVQDFKFVPWGASTHWFQAKEYALYMAPDDNRQVSISGWLSGRMGRLKMSRSTPMPCIKREYKFHSGDSLVFCAKPKSDSGTPSK